MRATCGVVSARTPSMRPDSGSTILNVMRSRSRPVPVSSDSRILEQRRLHQPVAARAKMVEQRAPQRFDARRLGRQHVLDGFGKEPLTHDCSTRSTVRPATMRHEADEAQLAVGELGRSCGTCRATARARRSGSMPSRTSTSASAAHSESTAIDRHRRRRPAASTSPARALRRAARRPTASKYWKNSPRGSSTITSLRPRNVALYASRLR